MIDYTARIEEAIRSSGQFVQAVLGSPPWAYTIGNTDRGMPEIVMTGLDPRLMHQLLNDAAEKRIDEEKPLVAGDFVSEIAGVPLRVDAVHPSQIEGMMQQAVYREIRSGRNHRAITAVQLVWPDAKGIYPGEPGCTKAVEEMQPLLSGPFVEKEG